MVVDRNSVKAPKRCSVCCSTDLSASMIDSGTAMIVSYATNHQASTSSEHFESSLSRSLAQVDNSRRRQSIRRAVSCSYEEAVENSLLATVCHSCIKRCSCSDLVKNFAIGSVCLIAKSCEEILSTSCKVACSGQTALSSEYLFWISNTSLVSLRDSATFVSL